MRLWIILVLVIITQCQVRRLSSKIEDTVSYSRSCVYLQNSR